MKGWLDPVGPESAQTYWIRRGAVGAVIVVLIVAVWWLATRAGGDGGAATSGLAVSGTTAASDSPVPLAEASGQPAASDDVAASASVGLESDPSASPEPEASPTPTETPATAACQPRLLTLQIAGPETVTGPDPVAFTVTASTSQANCILDLATAQAEVVVTSGSDRIWASSSCPAWQLTGTFEMKQGAEVSYEVGWPVRRGSDCELSDATLGAGTYVATANIGTASARHVMTLRP